MDASSAFFHTEMARVRRSNSDRTDKNVCPTANFGNTDTLSDHRPSQNEAETALLRLRPFGLQFANQIDLALIGLTVVERILQGCQSPRRVSRTVKCISPLSLDDHQ